MVVIVGRKTMKMIRIGQKCGKWNCIYGKWTTHVGSIILCAECASGIVTRLVGYSSVLTSGGFDPLHPGHLSNISDSSNHGELLIVVVNGDKFLEKKKGKAFMPLKVRCQIVSRISGVDIVVPFEPTNPDDTTVCEALEIIHPDVFAKGGDRNKDNIPEAETCNDLGITIIDGVGDKKLWSSSNFLKEWGEYYHNKIKREFQ
jgi:cytidyltransferase-like protein